MHGEFYSSTSWWSIYIIIKFSYTFIAVHHIPAIMYIYSFISSIMPVSVSTGLLHSTGCGLSVAGHITSGTSHYCSCVCSGEKDKTFLSWHEKVSKLIISRNTDFCFIFILFQYLFYFRIPENTCALYDMPTLPTKWVLPTFSILCALHIVRTRNNLSYTMIWSHA